MPGLDAGSVLSETLTAGTRVPHRAGIPTAVQWQPMTDTVGGEGEHDTGGLGEGLTSSNGNKSRSSSLREFHFDMSGGMRS